MVFDLTQPLPTPTDTPDIRRAATPDEVDDHLSITDAVFADGDAARLRCAYVALLADPHFSLFTAYQGGRAVAAARLESGAGGAFGSLYGGAVHPSHRGQGLYRALVHARADIARRLGLRYLATEAAETSRPILEQLGFTPLVGETTWILPAG